MSGASQHIARLVSIAGHPAALMTVAAVVAAPPQLAKPALATSLACAALVVGYSYYKTRRGDWSHIDASVPAERAEFNSRIGLGLFAIAALLAARGLCIGAVAIGLSSLIVVTGHLLRGVAKLSLHVAFAVFAIFLVWPNHVAASCLAGLALAVAWSRIALRRHTTKDLILGALAGAASGWVFQVLASRLAA